MVGRVETLLSMGNPWLESSKSRTRRLNERRFAVRLYRKNGLMKSSKIEPTLIGRFYTKKGRPHGRP